VIFVGTAGEDHQISSDRMNLVSQKENERSVYSLLPNKAGWASCRAERALHLTLARLTLLRRASALLLLYGLQGDTL